MTGDPATYAPDRIGDTAIRKLQSKVVSVDAVPEYDATYAWKMGGRVRITLADGTVAECEVHGQKGSMHDPLDTAELDTKCELLTAGCAAPDLGDAIRSVADGSLDRLTTALRTESLGPRGRSSTTQGQP